MDIVKRINAVIASLGITPNAFSKQLNYPQSSVDGYLKGQRRIPLEFAVRLAEVFPEVSMEWLIRGTGEMYLKPKMNEEEFEEWGNEPMPSIGLEQYKTLLEEMKRIQAKVDNLENKVG